MSQTQSPGADRRAVRDPRPDREGARAERRSRRRSPSKFCERENWLFLGRGYHYPVALEGALKLKEISYIHAEGMPAAEMKHGPIALINEGMPVVFIATQGPPVRQGDQQHRRSARPRRRTSSPSPPRATRTSAATATTSSTSPTSLEPLQPLLSVVPLQLLAYHAAVAARCNVDKPRNLAKSVTVE